MGQGRNQHIKRGRGVRGATSIPRDFRLRETLGLGGGGGWVGVWPNAFFFSIIKTLTVHFDPRGINDF